MTQKTHLSLSLPLLELNEMTTRKAFPSGYFMQPFLNVIKLNSTVKEMWKRSPSEQCVQLLKAGPLA